MFRRLLSKKYILPEEYKYLSYNFKKITNLRKLYFLRKTHKRLYNVPGRPVIFIYGTPTEKLSGYLDYHFKPNTRLA